MDCYYYIINLKGINPRKSNIQYFNVSSAIRPIFQGPDLLVTEPDDNMEYSSDSKHSDIVVAGDDTYKPEEDDQPALLTQAELNNLT